MNNKRKVCYFHPSKNYVGDRTLFIKSGSVKLNLCMYCDLESGDYILQEFLKVYAERKDEYKREQYLDIDERRWMLKDYERTDIDMGIFIIE